MTMWYQQLLANEAHMHKVHEVHEELALNSVKVLPDKIASIPPDTWFDALKYHFAPATEHKPEPQKVDISFQDTAQNIVNTVEKDIKPVMKRMTGRYYSKILEDLEKIRKLADDMRREAGNLGI